jgi:hypothetical protein
MVSRVALGAPPPTLDVRRDADDTWFIGGPVDETSIRWRRPPGDMLNNVDQELVFEAVDARGMPLDLEPYMGMLAHVVVAHRDGSVFAHLHPSGSISMAALRKFQPHGGHASQDRPGLAIPYAFPESGDYRLWVQVKHNGTVITAPFDAHVQ